MDIGRIDFAGDGCKLPNRKVTAMKINLTEKFRQAIAAELDRASQESGILDIYGVATKLQAQHPDENIAWEDVVQALLAGRADIRAIEFAERAPEILEIILPGHAENLASEPSDEAGVAVQ